MKPKICNSFKNVHVNLFVVNFAFFCSCLDKLVKNQYFLSIYSDVSKMLWKNAGLNNIPSRNIQIRKSLTRSDNRQTYNFETLILLTKVTHEHEHKKTSMKMSITNFWSKQKKMIWVHVLLVNENNETCFIQVFSSAKNPTIFYYIERKMLFVFGTTRRDDFW